MLDSCAEYVSKIVAAFAQERVKGTRCSVQPANPDRKPSAVLHRRCRTACCPAERRDALNRYEIVERNHDRAMTALMNENARDLA